MSVSSELEAQILRYYHVEKWRIGTIARQLHVRHGTVQRVLLRAGVPLPQRSARPSKIDRYLPFIRSFFKRWSGFHASRLVVCTPWSANAAIAAVPITFAI